MKNIFISITSIILLSVLFWSCESKSSFEDAVEIAASPIAKIEYFKNDGYAGYTERNTFTPDTAIYEYEALFDTDLNITHRVSMTAQDWQELSELVNIREFAKKQKEADGVASDEPTFTIEIQTESGDKFHKIDDGNNDHLIQIREQVKVLHDQLFNDLINNLD